MNTTDGCVDARPMLHFKPRQPDWLTALAPETFRSAELREAHFALCFFCRALSTKWCGVRSDGESHIAYEQLISG